MSFPCPKCGLPLPEGATYCPRCRPRVPCHRCGEPVYEKALVCPHCRQWLGNRWPGPFWFQVHGPVFTVGCLLVTAPITLGILWLLANLVAISYSSTQQSLARGANARALLVVAASVAISIILLYAVEKRARRKKD